MEATLSLPPRPLLLPTTPAHSLPSLLPLLLLLPPLVPDLTMVTDPVTVPTAPLRSLVALSSLSLSLLLPNLQPLRLPRYLLLPRLLLPLRLPPLPRLLTTALTRDPVKALAQDPVASLLELLAQAKESGTALVAHLSSDVPVVLGLLPSKSHQVSLALLDKVPTLA